MQKVFNALTVLSFGFCTIGVAAGVWTYTNRYRLINDIKNIAADEITEMIPIIAQEIMPEVPGGMDLETPSAGSSFDIPTF